MLRRSARMNRRTARAARSEAGTGPTALPIAIQPSRLGTSTAWNRPGFSVGTTVAGMRICALPVDQPTVVDSTASSTSSRVTAPPTPSTTRSARRARMARARSVPSGTAVPGSGGANGYPATLRSSSTLGRNPSPPMPAMGIEYPGPARYWPTVEASRSGSRTNSTSSSSPVRQSSERTSRVSVATSSVSWAPSVAPSSASRRDRGRFAPVAPRVVKSRTRSADAPASPWPSRSRPSGSAAVSRTSGSEGSVTM